MKTFTLTIAFVIAGTYSLVQGREEASPMEELSAKYKHAASEQERMGICVNAINRGLVYRGCSIKTFDSLFGTTLSKDVPAVGQPMERGTVNFADQPSAESDEVAVPFVGWYLAVEFDSSGLIQNYYLSNLHK